MNDANEHKPTQPQGPRWFRWLSERFTGPPEVQHLPWAKRARIVEQARTKGRAINGWNRVAMIGGLPLILILVFGLMAGWDFGWPIVFILAISFHLFVNVGSLLSQRRCDRAALREILQREGIRPAVCFDCGYDLRGTESPTCPECGADILDPPDDR